MAMLLKWFAADAADSRRIRAYICFSRAVKRNIAGAKRPPFF